MKVVIHLDGSSVRGNERQAAILAAGLVGRGHEVVAVCRAGGEVEGVMAASGARTVAVRPRGDGDLVSLLRFAFWLRRERPDALLLTSWKRAFMAGLGGRLGGVPQVVQRLGGPHRVRAGARGWKQRAALTRWPHRIVFNSEGLRDALLQRLPSLPRERTRVVYSGTDLAPGGVPGKGVRAELGLPAGSLVFLAVGGLEPLKGYEALIEALARLERRVHLVIAGGGTEERATLLRARASSAGVAPRLHLLGQRGDVGALLADADALVHASRIDSLPNAVLEAMRAGLPIVSTDVYGADELLAPREGRPAAGWIVPRHNLAALARGLGEVAAGIATGSDAVREAGAEARWRSEHWFTVDAMVDGYLAALEGRE